MVLGQLWHFIISGSGVSSLKPDVHTPDLDRYEPIRWLRVHSRPYFGPVGGNYSRDSKSRTDRKVSVNHNSHMTSQKMVEL